MVFLRTVDSEDEEVELGTCEICFHTSTVTLEWFVFEDGSGRQLDIPIGYVDYDGYEEKYPLRSIPMFGEYIQSKKIENLDQLNKYFDYYYNKYIETVENAEADVFK